METLHLSSCQPTLAARLLAGMAELDPTGRMCEDSIPGMARRGECFLATSGEGDQAVVVLRHDNGVTWVDAARALSGQGWTAGLFEAIERQAAGQRAVAFQTARAGLARRAQALGYEVTGYILRKKFP
ncbi:hypothetical protein GN316_03065 [Xylophilus sp. Kf1]|nr:hypothetical protein [Xylophilus sp. Kf1]